MNERTGLTYALGAYLLWGILPAYFVLVSAASPFEIVPWRVLFSLIFCALLLTVTRTWPALIAIFRTPRVLCAGGVAGLVIYLNWQVFIYGALAGRVLETSLGYFINPIVTVLLGVILLREKLRPLQWASVGVACVAVVILTVDYGRLPWISLVLAFSFALYGYVKKRTGARVDAIPGLTIETVWLAPVAMIQLAVVSGTAGLTIISVSPVHTALLVGTGAATAVPLLLFAAGARRLTLTQVGLTQFVAPILQFLFAVYIMHEAMPPARWVGFGIVWLAVLMLVIDMVGAGRRQRAAAGR
ncbi:EamA family transporter RarD [Klugiella xanthotipulae]|uniref:Chloramphenicol-sensitive protein RarD n=1 Tax=Klugiella xanthotipulae TaxID=244735 RepID=A0A543I5I5_9MICO|nr:EamA family transporter RarD [Klugiella xanthotipulae]TQM65720.1 chloramphenicol-sensitive protein RarD [Klugiella xanthotipulae]